jgi:TatD DNase family protein
MLTSSNKFGSAWYDSHCHLDKLPQLNRCLKEAAVSSIRHFVLPSTEQPQWHTALQIQKNHPNIKIALGTHPWFVKSPSDEATQLTEAIGAYSPCAVGEIGLDFYKAKTQRPKKIDQIESFCLQLGIARNFDLPVIIHSVRAHQEVIQFIKKENIESGVIHAFSGSLELAKQFLDLGFYLGVGPLCLRSEKLLSVIEKLPLAQLILETDAPYVTANDYESNSLLALIDVAKKVSSVKQMDLDDLKQITTENSLRLFGA